jgi:2-dehydro-3-deoxy-D-arabinonate dehydratase
MKLIQFFLPGKGKRVGLVQGDRVLDITSVEDGIQSTLDLVSQGKTAQGVATRASWLAKRLHRKGLDWRELQRPPSRRVPHLVLPVDAPEVWGVRDAYHSGPAAADAAEAFAALQTRPALFFKATLHRVAGPQAPIAIRHDSELTVPEAGLAVVLGPGGAPVGFTACNDVAARDIERRGLEYQSQARVYLGSCALGPCVVTSDEIEAPGALQVRCSVFRSGHAIFSDVVNTARLRWPIEALAGWLTRDNNVPPGTVLSTGTGIVLPDGMALREGDQVDVEVQSIGRLSNPVRRH